MNQAAKQRNRRTRKMALKRRTSLRQVRGRKRRMRRTRQRGAS